MPLDIQQRTASDVVILDLNGRLWILHPPHRELMNDLLTQGKRSFVLNLAGVSYIDSSGLGQLITIWTSIRNREGHMTILSPTKRVQRLLEITRLNAVFKILDNESDAIQSVRTASA